MIFLVSVGTVIPQLGPVGGGGIVVIGVVKARSKTEAVKKLGLVSWDGWKLIPGVNESKWRRFGKNYFFTSFDTKVIDRDPKAYANASRRMRIITLEQVKELLGHIPVKIWRQF